MRERAGRVLLAVAALGAAAPCTAQRRVTLAEAEAAALANGSRVRIAAADAAAARAAVTTARAYPNPTLGAVYSRSAPQYHLTAEQPLELPWLRSARVSAAQAGALGAGYRLAIERAAVRYAVDSLYVEAVAARELAALSARTAAEGAELVRVARVRRDAGDASDLDVELALVSQGGLENAALTDSLEAVAAVLDLQAAMGLPSATPTIVPAESLRALADGVAAAPVASLAAGQGTAGGTAPLGTAAAEADVARETAALAQAAAGRWAAPSVMGGVEWHDPSGGEPGYLPTFGVSLPLPLWDRNRGPVGEARAALDRANAALAAARREGEAALAAAERNRAAARVRMERDQALLAHADRVVALTTQGYREGAFPITTVIDAQRTAREALRQSIVDLAALRAAESAAALARTVGSAP
jgi:cobalt-zinc-cadmium efflux system outer membrane protein